MLKKSLYPQKFYKEAIGKNKCTWICHVLYILYHNILPEGQLDKNVDAVVFG